MRCMLALTCRSYPLDIIRRRMQTDGMLADRLGYGFFDMIKHVWRTEGLRGFYKGVTMNWIKASVMGRVYFGHGSIEFQFVLT